MDAAGRDIIIIETVGTGQSEVEIAEIADICVVVNAPGLGDDIQAIKAGLLEIADVLVVNKSDTPLADLAAKQLRSMLKLRDKQRAGCAGHHDLGNAGKWHPEMHALIAGRIAKAREKRPQNARAPYATGGCACRG